MFSVERSAKLGFAPGIVAGRGRRFEAGAAYWVGTPLRALHSALVHAMPHRLNPEKLLLSKWTAVTPQNREKHFLVTKLLRDADEQVVACVIEAVLSQRAQTMDCQVLRDETQWRQGWL